MNTLKLCALYAIGGLIVGYMMGLGHMLQLDDDYVMPLQEVENRIEYQDDDINCAVHGVCDAEIPPSLSLKP